MKRSLGVALFLIATTSVFAQSISEKIDVSLTNVDVTVTSHGAPARGLTSADFQVFEDGVVRPVTNFYAVEPLVIAGHPAKPTASDTSFADPMDERFRRKVLVLIDNRHVSMFRRDLALAALERFVDDRFTGGTYDWSIALISDKAHIVLPLTSDKAKLHATVASIREIAANPQRFPSEDTRPIAATNRTGASLDSAVKAAETGLGADPAETRQTLTDFGTNLQMEIDAGRTAYAVRDAIRSFAGVPGRKIILLVTGSLGLDPGISPLEANPQSFLSGPTAVDQGLRSSSRMRDALIHEANASNVSFFILNSEGLTSSIDAGDHANASMASNPNELASMYWLAQETGGRLMPGNSPEGSLAEFDRASSSFYSLAYKPTHGDDGKYHSIKVRIKRPDYELQYRTGYSSDTVNVQLARAMQSPLASSMQRSSIPINIITGNSTPHDGGVLVPLHSRIAAKDLQFLPTADGPVAHVDMFLTVFDDHGRKVVARRFLNEAHAASGTESNGDFVDTRQILIKRGVPYRVVVAVHDQVTDAIGISSKTVRF